MRLESDGLVMALLIIVGVWGLLLNMVDFSLCLLYCEPAETGVRLLVVALLLICGSLGLLLIVVNCS